MVVSLYSKFGNHSKFPKPPAACGCQYTFTNTSTLKKGTTRILEPQPLQVNKTPMLGLPLRLSSEILGAHNTEIMMCCWLELTIPTLESNSFWIELHTLAYVHIRRWFWNQTQCHDQGSFCIKQKYVTCFGIPKRFVWYVHLDIVSIFRKSNTTYRF